MIGSVRLPSLKPIFIISIVAIAIGSSSAISATPTAKPVAGNKVESATPSVSADCKLRAANEKVLILMAERYANGMNSTQSRYDAHNAEIERRLQRYGVSALSRDNLKKTLFQPEIDSHFMGDPSKAQRLADKQGATLTLRSLITSRRAFSPVRKANETYVSVNLALIDLNGYYISEAVLNSESFLGADTLGMALDLIKQRGDDAVLKLLSDYCIPKRSESKQ